MSQYEPGKVYDVEDLKACVVFIPNYESAVGISDIANERLNQNAKWGIQHHPDGTGSEEQQWQADWDRETTEHHTKTGILTWADILQEEVSEAFGEKDWDKLRVELIQVAAVALAWLEDGDTRNVSMDR